MQKFYKMKAALLLLAAMFSFGAVYAETGSETEMNATGGGSSNAQVDGQSYYVDGTYIAGAGSAKTGDMTSKGFKLRTGVDGKRVVFTVNENYTIKNFSLTGASNYELNTDGTKDVSVVKVEVDGVEVPFTGGEAFKHRGQGESCTLNVPNIEAKQSIAIYFDNGDSKGSQINACWALDWERPDATQPTITVTPEEVSLIAGATYQLKAKIDPASFATHWVSENESVATVDENGLVTAVATGAAVIKRVWDDDETVCGSAQIWVMAFDPAELELAKSFDFTTMGDAALTLESDAAGAIWNEANKKTNNVFFCTNEGLTDIAVQAALKDNKGWSIVEGEGLKLASGAGRCAAIGHLTAGQIVEIFYTGSNFWTGSHEDAVRKDDGAVKIAINEGVGRAIYLMDEDGMLGFEIDKGKAIQKINVYNDNTVIVDPDEIVIDMTDALVDEAGYLKTLSCPFDLDFTEVEGIKAYTAVKNYDNYNAVASVTLKPIDVVPAGTGIVVKAEAAKEYLIPVPEDLFVEEFQNELLVAGTDVDLTEAVKTDSWGDFVSGPALLAKGTIITGINWDTFEYIYDEANGFFPADPETDELKAGGVYLPIAEGEWDSYGSGYVKLIFADQATKTYESIADLVEGEPVQQDAMGVAAALDFKNTGDVKWTNGSYMLVEDNTGGIIMQVPEGFSVKAGDNFLGTYTGTYSNVLMPQLIVSPMTDASQLAVLDNAGEPEPIATTLVEAYGDQNIMRLVKISNLKLNVKVGTYSNDYYIEDENGTEVYLNDAFSAVGSELSGQPDGTVISEMVGIAFIVPEESPYVSMYNYDMYEFIPLSVKAVATGVNEMNAEGQKAPVYTLQGVRVDKVQKGAIYIQNGKKVVKK